MPNNRTFWKRWLHNAMPHQRHLQGTWLHRLIGEKLFHPDLWKPSRHTIAGGLATGIFIALTPTIGVQMVIAGIAAYFLRVNIPVAIAACWVTNPLTAPVIYYSQYELGKWLVGSPSPEEVDEYEGGLRWFIYYAKPLSIGSFVQALAGAAAAYTLIYSLWSGVGKLFHAKRSHREDEEHPDAHED